MLDFYDNYGNIEVETEGKEVSEVATATMPAKSVMKTRSTHKVGNFNVEVVEEVPQRVRKNRSHIPDLLRILEEQKKPLKVTTTGNSDAEALRAQLYVYARRHGIKISTSVLDEKTLILKLR